MEIIQEDGAVNREFIRKKVIEHNMANLSPEVKSPIELKNFIMRNEKQEIVGGLTTTSFWHSLRIDFLWVDSSMRGQRLAEKLMAQAEVYARSQIYRVMIVDTFSFQAPDFYRKQGFTEFGRVSNHPEGHSQHYFEKWLVDPIEIKKQ